jgi:hypothetical protein
MCVVSFSFYYMFSCNWIECILQSQEDKYIVETASDYLEKYMHKYEAKYLFCLKIATQIQYQI